MSVWAEMAKFTMILNTAGLKADRLVVIAEFYYAFLRFIGFQKTVVKPNPTESHLVNHKKNITQRTNQNSKTKICKHRVQSAGKQT